MTASSSNDYLLKKAALEKVVEHNRDYLKVDITLPLGDPALKHVHTNQWLFTVLPAEFDLLNWTVIAEHLNANSNRYEKYVKNRWYIESNSIKVVAGGKAEMKLGLNAFASTYKEFTDAFKKFQDDYKSASSNTGGTTSASKKTTNAVGTNTTLKGGAGTYLDNLVKKIVGKETDPLKKAKLIHYHLKDYIYYSKYCCCKYGKDAERAYKAQHLNCGDTATLTTQMMRSAGLDADVVHGPNHFWTRIKISGKEYFSDCTSSNGNHSYREFNEVWDNLSYYEVNGSWCGCDGYDC